MTRKILLALLCCSVGLSGCERLSEKDRVDIIAKCDTEARKKIEEYPIREDGAASFSDSEVSTHYSFSKRRCFALQEKTYYERTPRWTSTLYDGLTKQMLIFTSETSAMAGQKAVYMTTFFVDGSDGVYRSKSVQHTSFEERKRALSEIDRLMNLP